MKRIAKVNVMVLIAVLVFVSLATPPAANAQLAGENLKGDLGLTAGSQAPPGVAYGFVYYDYDTGRVNNKDGKQVNAGGNINIWAVAPLISVVTKKKFLGANYGFMFVLPFLNAEIETPHIVSNPSAGVGDIYLVPAQLGWHFKQADVTTSYGIFVPSGRYTAGASDNTGLGMWSHELNLGTTVFFDKKKTWHAATNAAFEFHTAKMDTNSTEQVGNILTLEGGVGRSFLHGLAKVGLVYYSQWKISDDKLGALLPSLLVTGRNSATALGPEVTFPIVSKKKEMLYGFFTARYEWEARARTTTKGNAFILTLAFPLKPISLKPPPPPPAKQ